MSHQHIFMAPDETVILHSPGGFTVEVMPLIDADGIAHCQIVTTDDDEATQTGFVNFWFNGEREF